MLKIENNTNYKKRVSWNNELWYNDECVNCNENSNEEYRDIIIEANNIIEGSCDINTNSTLKIFSKFLNYSFEDWILSDFHLKNLIVINLTSQDIE
jgi:hypothetical protein